MAFDNDQNNNNRVVHQQKASLNNNQEKTMNLVDEILKPKSEDKNRKNEAEINPDNSAKLNNQREESLKLEELKQKMLNHKNPNSYQYHMLDKEYRNRLASSKTSQEEIEIESLPEEEVKPIKVIPKICCFFLN